ncbi:aspartyl-phosphate phosphatase Spo0E family protein [Clostridium akagii]|uniref:aspartyl-phosphate phosphatase Spo0E family protein n=1 Tax=Clostridium akagii TaxID=91623 RepID=UPI00047E56DC|nr:aspartyl-phosphate phosphatase Spo0E family protein [Clostridium akagii]
MKNNEKLEQLREELNKLILNNNFNTTEEVLAKSLELDKVVFVVQAKMCSNGYKNCYSEVELACLI